MSFAGKGEHMKKFLEHPDAAEAQRVLDTLYQELSATEKRLNELQGQPTQAALMQREEAGKAIITALKAGRPVPEAVEHRTTVGQELGRLYRRKRDLQEAVHQARNELERIRQNRSAEVREELLGEFRSTDRAALEWLAKAALAFADGEALRQDMERAGYLPYLPRVTKDVLGSPRDHASPINYLIRDALQAGLLTGREPWLGDFNHDGRYTALAGRKAQPMPVRPRVEAPGWEDERDADWEGGEP
jgi:hypothetical protein